MRLLPIRVVLLMIIGYLSFLGVLGHLKTTHAQTFGPACETTPVPGSTSCPTNTPVPPIQPQPTLPVTAGPSTPMIGLLVLGGAMIVAGGGYASLSLRKNRWHRSFRELRVPKIIYGSSRAWIKTEWSMAFMWQSFCPMLLTPFLYLITSKCGS